MMYLLMSHIVCLKNQKRLLAIVSPDGENQNKECLLKGYIYPFPMRRILQFGTSPFQCCD